jgi:hypothetical protein
MIPLGARLRNKTTVYQTSVNKTYTTGHSTTSVDKYPTGHFTTSVDKSQSIGEYPPTSVDKSYPNGGTLYKFNIVVSHSIWHKHNAEEFWSKGYWDRNIYQKAFLDFSVAKNLRPA